MSLLYRKARRVTKRILLGDLPSRPQIRCERENHGSYYGGMVVCPTALDASSVVYDFGLGGDISFGLSLIDRYGLEVHGFDPTPQSIAWVKQQQLPERFHLHEFGLGGQDGHVRMQGIWEAGDDGGCGRTSFNYSLAVDHGKNDTTVEAPIHRLRTIMDMLGHDRVDLLKIDIEGAEYEVLEDFLDDDPPDVRQIIIDFHHRFESIGWNKTADAIARLNRHGYRLFSTTWTHWDFSFLRVRDS